MLISERKCLGLVKVAYRGDGYRVTVDTIEGELWIGIGGDGWAVACKTHALPRKVLGLIAEHLGVIPKSGESYKVQRDENQQAIFEPLPLLMVTEQEKTENVRRTCLTLGGYPVWQSVMSNTVVLVPPHREALVELSTVREAMLLPWERMWFRDPESFVRLDCLAVLDELLEMLDYLEKYRWVPGY